MKSSLPPYLTIEKNVGETPLQALERLRVIHSIPDSLSLAYAGRLDPMASGLLLILVGDECKIQEGYHSLDKEYTIEVLLGASSDTGDILGIVEGFKNTSTILTMSEITKSLEGTITLPYPHYSSKTVQGKPLHTWALEGRLHEIAIPEKTSMVYSLKHTSERTMSRAELLKYVTEKIALLPVVTDPKKALGEDFRREKVLASWHTLIENNVQREYTIHSFTCICSSGTYMRTLAEQIGTLSNTHALALSIHRTRIGTYIKIPLIGGFFRKSYGR